MICLEALLALVMAIKLRDIAWTYYYHFFHWDLITNCKIGLEMPKTTVKKCLRHTTGFLARNIPGMKQSSVQIFKYTTFSLQLSWKQAKFFNNPRVHARGIKQRGNLWNLNMEITKFNEKPVQRIHSKSQWGETIVHECRG